MFGRFLLVPRNGDDKTIAQCPEAKVDYKANSNPKKLITTVADLSNFTKLISTENYKQEKVADHHKANILEQLASVLFQVYYLFLSHEVLLSSKVVPKISYRDECRCSCV
jgi:hypothetical protein